MTHFRWRTNSLC